MEGFRVKSYGGGFWSLGVLQLWFVDPQPQNPHSGVEGVKVATCQNASS